MNYPPGVTDTDITRRFGQIADSAYGRYLEESHDEDERIMSEDEFYAEQAEDAAIERAESLQADRDFWNDNDLEPDCS